MGITPISCKCLKTCKDVNEEIDLAKSDYLRSRTGNFKINNDPRSLAPLKQIKSMSYNSLSLKTENITNSNNNNYNYNENPIKETFRNQIIEETEENKYIETNNGILKTVNTLNNNKNENNINKDENNNIINIISKEKNDNKEGKDNSENNKKIEKSSISRENKDDSGNIENNESSSIFKEKKNENSIMKENEDELENSKSLGSIKKDKKLILFNENSNPDSSFCSIKNHENIKKNKFLTNKLKKAEKIFENPINYEKDWKQYCDDPNNEDMLILIGAINSSKIENHTPEEGKIIELNGEKCLYIGELDKNQKPIGFGVLYTNKGAKYEGNFSKGKLIGLGRHIDKNGVCYEGIFEDNKLIGKAKILKYDENGKIITYFGETKNFQKDGEGEETCDKYRYAGKFSEDLRQGYGCIQFFETGDLYEGYFNQGEMEGKGTYIWKNQNYYKGDFVKGKMHGKGKYKWPEGYEYEGEYKNGNREGLGTYKWKDGRTFKGRFKNSVPDGKGKLSYKSRTVIVEYKDGKLIPSEELKQFLAEIKKEKEKEKENEKEKKKDNKKI